MKIVHIQKVAGIAGSENHLLTLLPRLQEYGYEPTMLVLADRHDRPGSFIERMRAAGVPVFLIPMGGDFDPLLIPRLARFIRQGKYDIVHTHLFHADLYGALAARIAGVKHIISTKHGFDPWRCKRLYASLDRLAAAFQKRIITISAAIGQWLVDVEGLPAEKLCVVHYALDAQQFRASAQGDAPPPISRPVIGTVTRLIEQKGVQILLQAFAHCCQHHPQASLVIVGEGPARLHLENIARKLKIAERVYFLGYRTDVSSLMHAFDIFVLPTFGEGFGLVLLEAMAWGKPVVASDVMSIPEIVQHEETGLLVPPRDPLPLAQALVRLMGNPTLCQQLGMAGRRRVESQFTVERMVEQTVQIYEEVLGLTPNTLARPMGHASVASERGS